MSIIEQLNQVIAEMHAHEMDSSESAASTSHITQSCAAARKHRPNERRVRTRL